MSLTLHLGVVDIPYTEHGGLTTGDVAGFLENKYHVMEVFANQHLEDVIAPALEDSLRGHLETLLMGGPSSGDPFATGTEKIRHGFDTFITMGEMEMLGYPGVPTMAAIKRKSARFKKGRARRVRPSFVDTGLYLNSFTSWVD